MRTFFIYLQLELKRTMKGVPYFFAGAIVLALLAGTIAFSAAQMLYGEQVMGRIPVGVVVSEEDVLASKAMQMIESLDSVDSLCEFTYLAEEEGRKRLQSGELFALMKLPEGLVEGIMDGSNFPVTVIFPEDAGLEASVFRELTEAGTSILGTSQAGIYAADAYLWEQGMAVYVPKAEEDLNRIFLSYALDREVYFRNREVSAAGDVSAVMYFTISVSVLALLLLGIPAAPLMRQDTEVLRQKLALLGLGCGKRAAVKCFCLWLLLIFVSAIPFFICIKYRYIRMAPGEIGLWFLICLAAAGWIQLFYELCRNSAAAILSLFLTAVVMVFLAGGIVPSVFLPAFIGRAGAFLPAAFLIEGVRWLVSGVDFAVNFWISAAKLAGMAVLCFLLSVKAGKREGEG